MAQIKQTCAVTNGSQVVVISGVNLTDRIRQNHIFMVEGLLVPYTVALDSTYAGGNTTVTLTGAYQGPTNAAAAGVFATDFTYPDNLPTIAQGDVGTAAVFTAAMYRVQALVGSGGGLTSKAPLASPAFTGNMGIGTVVPDAKLALRGGDGTYSGGITLAALGGNVYGIYPTINDMVFRSVTGAKDAMRISYGGQVLINTAADNGSDKLQVAGSAMVTGRMGIGVSAANEALLHTHSPNNLPNYFRIGQAGQRDWYIGMHASAPSLIFKDASANAERMRITETGNVGIGTQTPTAYANIQTLMIQGPLGAALDFGATSVVQGTHRVAQLYAASQGFLSVATGANDALTERMRITETGNLLVGTTTDNGIDKVQVNGVVRAISASTQPSFIASGKNLGHIAPDISITRSSSNTNVGAAPAIQFDDGTATNSRMVQNGSGNLQFFGNGTGSWQEHARINLNGNLLVGDTTGASHVLSKESTVDDGSAILQIYRKQTGIPSANFYSVSQYLPNSGGCAVTMGRNGNTLRSLNASGTLNAHGADYAEYMTKDETCGVLAKGAIVGVTADGKLTDQWSKAISFVIKSTDPSYVGGDTWGTEAALGLTRPVAPERAVDVTRQRVKVRAKKATKTRDAIPAVYETVVTKPGDSDEQWQTKLDAHAAAVAAFDAALEAARATVDRIAFAGQVPVNVLGAQPGQYVVPAKTENGDITGVLVPAADMTLPWYMTSVGIVQNILADGRANVRVKVA